jgi:hypothetical protein
MMKFFQSISKYGKTIKFALSRVCQMLHTQKG